MLDTSFHQGAGLHCSQQREDLRMLVVTTPRGSPQTVEALWQLCRSLQAIHYSVAVLDATEVETDYAPGLHQMLQQAPWGEYIMPGTRADTSALTVVPAALGLLGLINAAERRDQAHRTLEPLEPIFRRYSVLVIHAPLELLSTPVLTGYPTTPLLLAQPGSAELMECYRQIKHLAMHAGMSSRVAYMVAKDDLAQQQAAETNIKALERCVSHHLGQRLRATVVHHDCPTDLQRLGLLLLENASSLTAATVPTWQAPVLPSSAPPFTAFAQSH